MKLLRRNKRIQEFIRQRVNMVADYFIKNESTIRKTAEALGVPRTTVHKDIERLSEIDFIKHLQARKILERNWNEKSMRGGEATRLKFFYERMKNRSCG